jgi:hypothetical protein
MAADRNLLILGVGPSEFLVRADDSAEAVRGGLEKMLGGVSFELQPLSDQQADRLENRLTAPQLDLLKTVSRTVGVSVKKNRAAHFLVRLPDDQRLAAAATPRGVLKFNPIVDKVRKPLPGGVGPVGVTVGICIAGKF